MSRATALRDLTVLDLLQNPEEWLVNRTRQYGLYPALVEDNKDPEQRGRLRVRVHGIDRADTPKEDLKWAMPLFPQGGNKGFGSFEVPSIGACVAIDHWMGSPNHPFWIGTIVNARAGKTDLVPEAQEKYSGTFSPKGVVYPNNSVRKTPGGILEERDDTPGQVRFHIRTPGGHSLVLFEGDDDKFVQLLSIGGFAIRIDDTNKKIRISTPKGSVIELDDNDSGQIRISTPGDLNVNVEGNANIDVKKDAVTTVQGNSTTTVKGNADIDVTGNATLKATTVAVESDSVDVGEATLPPTAGAVTGECIDTFTGRTFSDFSGVGRIKKLP